MCLHSGIVSSKTVLKKQKNIVTHLGQTLYIKKDFEAQTHHACAVLKSVLTVKSAIPDRSLSYKQASLRNCRFTTVTLSSHTIYLQGTIKQASNALDQLA